MAGKRRLVMTVDAFRSSAKRARRALDREAEIVAETRGASEVEVVYGSF
jgi:hypothetical protein